MNVLVVSFFEAYPPASGAASVTYNFAKHAEGDVTLVQMGDGVNHVLVDGLNIVTLPAQSSSRWAKLFGLFKKVRLILDCIREKTPNVVVLEGASWVLYHLFLLHRIRAKFPEIKVVYHSHNVEYVLREQKHGAIVTAVTKYCEGAILHNADLNLAVSDVDADIFERLYAVRPEVLPNAVDVGRFDKVSNHDVSQVMQKYGIGKNSLLFMGSYFYMPNKEGLDFLVEKVMPKVIEKYPSVTLVVLGTDELPFDEPWLLNLGLVNHEELPAIVKSVGAGMAPIFSGSGTRLKILEYMFAKIPVVATRKGAEGLSVSHGKELLFAENAEEFFHCIDVLYSDQEQALFIAKQGEKVVRKEYSWSGNMKKFSLMLHGI